MHLYWLADAVRASIPKEAAVKPYTLLIGRSISRIGYFLVAGHAIDEGGDEIDRAQKAAFPPKWWLLEHRWA